MQIVVSGRFGLDEIFDVVDAIVRDPDFEPGYSLRSDHRDIEEPSTVDQLQAMVSHRGKYTYKLERTHWAIVTQSAASYGMMRMLSVLGQRAHLTIEVFSSLEAAESWLQSHAAATSGDEVVSGGGAQAGGDADGEIER